MFLLKIYALINIKNQDKEITFRDIDNPKLEKSMLSDLLTKEKLLKIFRDDSTIKKSHTKAQMFEKHPYISEEFRKTLNIKKKNLKVILNPLKINFLKLYLQYSVIEIS